jgi:hypothetical protein
MNSGLFDYIQKQQAEKIADPPEASELPSEPRTCTPPLKLHRKNRETLWKPTEPFTGHIRKIF